MPKLYPLQSRRQHEAEQRVVIDPKAEPPPEKFYRLSERIPKFQCTWDRRRRGKWTAQSYEVQLARYADDDDDEWTGQEIDRKSVV